MKDFTIAYAHALPLCKYKGTLVRTNVKDERTGRGRTLEGIKGISRMVNLALKGDMSAHGILYYKPTNKLPKFK